MKLGNFRTYEDLRFKLVQLNESHRRDFVIRAHEVKFKIRENIGNSFKEKFMYLVNIFLTIL